MVATIVKACERKPLHVLGMPLTMFCEARETGGAWSLFEEEVPLGMGPPPDRHDWDEAYYILDGEVEFTIDGWSVRSSRSDFNYLPRGTVYGFKGASDGPVRVLIFAAPVNESEFFHELKEQCAACPRCGQNPRDRAPPWRRIPRPHRKLSSPALGGKQTQ